ncbi:MAG TPA: methyltransferase domain-containing protein [Planctomycetota bacterium]|nr:methyltransferase domain-containing protein [Planctomycetota bacterium]
MPEDFWTRAQEGERAFWQTAFAREVAGDPAKRRESWDACLAVIRRHRPFQPGDRVLDLGCGPAGLITAVDPACERYGVDPLMDFYRESYALPPEIRYSRQMGEKLDFPDAFFHVATCINALDHTRRPADVCRELARVLRPGGCLLLEVNVYRGYQYLRKRFRRWTRCLRRRPEKHPHTFRVADVEKMARRGGLRIVEQAIRPHQKRVVLRLLLAKPAD